MCVTHSLQFPCIKQKLGQWSRKIGQPDSCQYNTHASQTPRVKEKLGRCISQEENSFDIQEEIEGCPCL